MSEQSTSKNRQIGINMAAKLQQEFNKIKLDPIADKNTTVEQHLELIRHNMINIAKYNGMTTNNIDSYINGIKSSKYYPEIVVN